RQVPPVEIKQVIERSAARYMANLQSLSEELGRHLAQVEHERDALPTRTTVVEDQQNVIAPRSENVYAGLTGPEAPTPPPVFAQQRQLDQFRVYRSRLQAQYQALRERLQLWVEGRSGRFAYSLRIILMFCIIAVLMSLGIVSLLSPSGNRSIGARTIGPT